MACVAYIAEVFASRTVNFGSNDEWLELRGAPGASMSGLKIRHLRYKSAAEPAVVVFDLDVTESAQSIDSSGRFVVGGRS